MVDLDYVDILLHVIAAVVIVLLSHFLFGSWVVGCVFNSVFWLVREIIQHEGLPDSWQSNLEWITPVLASLATGFILENM